MSFLLCSWRKQKSCLAREEERVPCVTFSYVDPDILSAACSNHVLLSPSVEGSCGKTEQEARSAA